MRSLHLFSVLVAVVVLLLPSPAAARTPDAVRFADFAAHARAAGSLTFSVTFRGAAATCATAGTCGLSGTVRARLRLSSRKPLRVGRKLIVLPVHGIATARVRDTVAGRQCTDKVRVDAAGLIYVGDGHGLLLRPA